ncbi:hypothetical protein YEEN111655_07490 [Yersinia entomophaga]
MSCGLGVTRSEFVTNAGSHGGEDTLVKVINFFGKNQSIN